jgi:hypothetical protein
LVEKVSLTTTPKKVEHKLSTSPLGCIVVSQDANAVIFQTAKDENFITLQASAAVTVNIWVF